MEFILSFLSVDKVFLTIWNYPLSYLEFVGTICYLWSVWLISQRNILTWPVGIVSVILFGILFYQIQLYSDTLEQFYYLGASAYGWWYWESQRQKDHTREYLVKVSSPAGMLIWAGVTIVITMIVTLFMQNIHLILPRLFPKPASYPFVDTLTTIMSFVAMFLMARKKIESWVYWIIVDVIGIFLYYIKNVKFISLLYVILLILAVRGLIVWNKDLQTQKQDRIAAEAG